MNKEPIVNELPWRQLLSWQRLRLPTPYRLYLLSIAAIGLGVAANGALEIPRGPDAVNFALILALAVAASSATTIVPELTFEIGSAVSAAAIPVFGPFAAAFVAAASAAAAWVFQGGRTFWQKSWEQLAFNMGMQSIASFAAGQIYLLLTASKPAMSPVALVLSWTITAIAYDQINFWLLMGIIRLQNGRSFQARAVWRENTWAMAISISLIAFGGGLLAYAALRFGWSGIAVFFLPIVLSAYAFRLYVSKMQAHMKNLENIVAARTSELQAVMREKDAFLAVLTHDMKTPLTSIGLYAHLIAQHPDILRQKPQMTEVILRSQRTLLDIVNNILDLEKLQAGGEMPIVREYIDLLPLIECGVDDLRAQAVSKGIDLQVDTGPVPLLIDADRSQIERVLANMISNAIKYTPDGGHVMVRARAGDEWITIDVEDTGYGIPEEDLPYIFDRFRRVDKHKSKAAGTGLGLAIARAIVEAHGGTIHVTSAEGTGSVFTISLPTGGHAVPG